MYNKQCYTKECYTPIMTFENGRIQKLLDEWCLLLKSTNAV